MLYQLISFLRFEYKSDKILLLGLSIQQPKQSSSGESKKETQLAYQAPLKYYANNRIVLFGYDYAAENVWSFYNHNSRHCIFHEKELLKSKQIQRKKKKSNKLRNKQSKVAINYNIACCKARNFPYIKQVQKRRRQIS